MFGTVLTGALQGMSSYLVRVEVDVSRGLPTITMVGSVSVETGEAKERVRVAMKNSGVELLPLRITINLAPARLKKEGTAFDLAIAIGIMLGMELFPENRVADILFLGELGLDGALKTVRGIIPILQQAKREGITRCILPGQNRAEAELIGGMKIVAVESLADVISFLKNAEWEQMEASKGMGDQLWQVAEYPVDFSEVQGQFLAKRSMEIAAAGFHNLLLTGPPGAGKSMLARRLPTILPSLSEEESLEVSAIYSVAGICDEKEPVRVRRPFLSPHHTISEQALVGGGAVPRPGVISLAHKGVLFLDELPEFRRATIEVMRQPLEDRRVTIARAAGNYTFPADFLLCAAANPCPCGYFPDLTRCNCTEYARKKYASRISGPILDRIDMCVEVERVDLYQEDNVSDSMWTSQAMRGRVEAARERQNWRFREEEYAFNSAIPVKQMDQYCRLDEKTRTMFYSISKQWNLSARTCHRVLKLARTIADLAQEDAIAQEHIFEALMFNNSDFQRNGQRLENDVNE